MGGYNGKVLRINLTEGKISTEPLNKDLAKKYLSGRGLAGKMFFDEVAADVDALSPENTMYIATGVLTGTNAPTSGRFMVVTKSPLNGCIASSNSGGYWGAQLKFAGYDMVILEGKSPKPVYIAITDDKVEIKDAAKVWGKDVYATTDALKLEFGDDKAKVLTIGPAGETLSLNAAIMNDLFRAAGRSGVGAVMGSKNLKAVVVRGTGKVQNANPDEMKKVLSAALGKIKENGVTGAGLPTYGTAILVNIVNESGIFPVNNFQDSYDPNVETVSGETMTANHLIKKDACYRCPIACGRYSKWEGGEGAGPEYEAVWSFGPDCGIHDYDAIHVANDLCNKLGMDSISAGTTIATAMELFQRGYIKPEELEGIPLEFGNVEGMVEWTRKMAYAEGFGAKLAQGSYRLAESYGHAELSMTVKKLDIPAYDPRGIQGHGLQYATNNRGGCHVRGYMVSPEILGLPQKLDKDTLEGKATWVKIFQDLTGVIDSIGMCLFTSFALGLPEYTAIVNAVTGENYTDEELLACGERIWNVERLQNLRVGMTIADDTLPERLLKVPIKSGPSKGSVHRLPELLPAYYAERGWDEAGVPTPERLKTLGI
ncbi:MAG TPA: aldehyde ferredoxin oxidoreductase family protein [Desulfosporosinus sp.]|nr:aldehyde ferredoxin oxidoreductase family protein [Desulfosporosinus sp.]